MLRFAIASAVTRQSLSVAFTLSPLNKPLQVIAVGQRRWLAQRIPTGVKSRIESGTATMHADKSNKVTPLGWFLLVIPVTTFGLGCWQVKRKAWKKKLIKDLEEQTKLAAVSLPDNLADLSQMEYRLVTVRGTFLHGRELLLGPRSFIRQDGAESAGGLFSKADGGNGYLVVTPFKLADKEDIILINRGWVSRKQTRPETRAQGQTTEELELTGVVRMGEKRPQFSPEHKSDVFLYRDLPKMCTLTGASPVFLDATYESSVPGGPVGGQTRVMLRNDHLSYLITWFSLSAATSFMWYRQIIKRIPF